MKGAARILLPFGAACALCAVLALTLSGGGGPGELVFSTWGTPSEIAGFRVLIEHYNATRHPRHPVRLSHAEQYQYTERLMVQAAARGLPDVIHLDRNDVPLFARMGLLEDLAPCIAGDTSFRRGDFFPELWDGCSSGKRTWAIPHNFSTLVLYYNRDQFDAAGIAYPDSTWTWETLLDAAKRLTRRGADSTTLRYGCLMQIAFSAMLLQNGGRVLDGAMDSCVIGSPECAGALSFAVDLSEKERVSWSMLAQNMQWDDMFAGGRLSMIANGRWALIPYVHAMGRGAVDVAPLPRGRTGGGAVACHVMAVSAQSAMPDEAWEFLRYLVSAEGERLVAEGGSSIPALRAAAMSDEILRAEGVHGEVFIDELRGASPWPFVQGPYLSGYALQSRFEAAVRRVLLGTATPLSSLRTMEADVNALIRNARDVPRAREFAGSALSYLCAAIAAAAGAAVLRSVARKRRSRQAR